MLLLASWTAQITAMPNVCHFSHRCISYLTASYSTALSIMLTSSDAIMDVTLKATLTVSESDMANADPEEMTETPRALNEQNPGRTGPVPQPPININPTNPER